jgi:hypothetical protein
VSLNASSGFKINLVFWLRSLSASEQGPTRRVLEDLEPFFDRLGLPFQLRDVKTAPELYTALDSLANPKVKPILQLDMHGRKEGLLLSGSSEIAAWEEVVPRLRAINIASEGNLCVVAGVCFALYAIKEASISQPSPVNILVAPDREVQTGKLEDGLTGFYKSLLSDGEISAAFTEHLGDPFKLFNAEGFFVIALRKYIRSFCKGKGGAVRRERLLTEILFAGRPRSPQNLREIRRQVRDKIKPDQELVDRYAHTFLLGRACPFSIDELMNEVEAAR